MRTQFLAKASNLACLFSLLIAFAAVSFGQSDLTTVTGTIHDPSGAVVANAAVTIRNQATGAERRARTNEGGSYSIPSISAGTYDLIVEAPGFKRFEQQGNTFQANVASTLDATLTVGNATETVQV